MKMSDILSIDSIVVGMEAESKEELLSKLVDLASQSGRITNKEKALKEIFERENILSTGVGKGIALPHAKTNAVTNNVGALCILNEPIDYDSLDGEPVNIIFMLFGLENNVGTHLKLLSKISRLMNNDSFRTQLLVCKSSKQVLEHFEQMEESD